MLSHVSKKKRNGTIKGRGCGSNIPQRVYKAKEEISPPTACIKSIFITAVVEAYKGRNVAVVNIPGAFLQPKASHGTIIKLQGPVVEALLQISPAWEKVVVYAGKKRIPTICNEAIKALYGTVDTSKLFFDDMTSFLVETMSFTPNPFNLCVVNKKNNGKQYKISWHVDSLKIAHQDANVVMSMIMSLSNKYGKLYLCPLAEEKYMTISE